MGEVYPAHRPGRSFSFRVAWSNIGHMSKRMTWIFGIVFITGAAALYLWGASTRVFWDDERYGMSLLGTPVSRMLLHGMEGQCSPAPGFYLLSEAWFSVFPKGTESHVIARVPSAIAGALFLGWILRTWLLSPWIAFFTAFSLFRDEIFIGHVTEIRPFPVWLLLTAAIWLPFWNVVERREARRDYWLLGFFALLLTVTATGSLFFLAGMGLYVLLFRRHATWKLAVALAPAVLIGAYYASLSSCVDHAHDGPFSFFTMLRTGDFTLLKQITKMVFSPKAWADIPVNLCIAFAAWTFARERDSHGVQRRALAAGALVFGTASVLTTIAIAMRNYFFIPRMFFFLLAFRAVLVASVLEVAVAEISRRLGSRWSIAGKAFVLAYGALCVYLALKVSPLSEIR
jgi:hypothetical protein